jgi:hypothetical protein
VIEMADSRIQLEIENWIRMQWLPPKYGQPFIPCRLRLNTGGFFDFDAVSSDGLIVANISTSSALTARNKPGIAKMQKLRSDILFLLMVEAKTRLIILSEKDMFDQCLREKKAGRIPQEIEFVNAEIPESLKDRLTEAKLIASQEVTPVKS